MDLIEKFREWYLGNLLKYKTHMKLERQNHPAKILAKKLEFNTYSSQLLSDFLTFFPI